MNDPRPNPPATLRPATQPAHHPTTLKPGSPAPAGPPKIEAVPTLDEEALDLTPIGLEDAPETTTGPSKIKAFGVAGMAATREKWTRKPNANSTGACRVRTFHGRLSDEGMGFLDDKINEWLDQHPEYEVKFVTTTIGTFEGKIREPALIVNVWY